MSGPGAGRVLSCGVGLALLAAVVAAAELLDPQKGEKEGRIQRSRVGATPEEWARHLDDSHADVRLEAVKLLAESNYPNTDEYLMQAVDNSDPRVAATAVDALGKLEARDAASFLAEHLAMAGTSAGLRQRILVALGRIKDPKPGRDVLSFVQAESDPELKSLGIRVLGEIGDESIRGDLHGLAARENNPDAKRLLEDAEAKIAARGAPTRSASPP